MNKIQLCDKYKCTQCMACVNTCPKNCIHMEDAGEGFCVPRIDRNACIKCGACMKSCHMISHNVERQTPLKTLLWYWPQERRPSDVPRVSFCKTEFHGDFTGSSKLYFLPLFARRDDRGDALCLLFRSGFLV